MQKVETFGISWKFQISFAYSQAKPKNQTEMTNKEFYNRVEKVRMEMIYLANIAQGRTDNEKEKAKAIYWKQIANLLCQQAELIDKFE